MRIVVRLAGPAHNFLSDGAHSCRLHTGAAAGAASSSEAEFGPHAASWEWLALGPKHGAPDTVPNAMPNAMPSAMPHTTMVNAVPRAMSTFMPSAMSHSMPRAVATALPQPMAALCEEPPRRKRLREAEEPAAPRAVGGGGESLSGCVPQEALEVTAVPCPGAPLSLAYSSAYSGCSSHSGAPPPAPGQAEAITSVFELEPAIRSHSVGQAEATRAAASDSAQDDWLRYLLPTMQLESLLEERSTLFANDEGCSSGSADDGRGSTASASVSNVSTSRQSFTYDATDVGQPHQSPVADECSPRHQSPVAEGTRATNILEVGALEVSDRLFARGETLKAGGSSMWTVVSDARLKHVVASFDLGQSELVALQPKIFQYNGKAGTVNDGRSYVGLIAQEVHRRSLTPRSLTHRSRSSRPSLSALPSPLCPSLPAPLCPSPVLHSALFPSFSALCLLPSALPRAALCPLRATWRALLAHATLDAVGALAAPGTGAIGCLLSRARARAHASRGRRDDRDIHARSVVPALPMHQHPETARAANRGALGVRAPHRRVRARRADWG